MTLTCDKCYASTDEHEDIIDAAMAGWWFVDGPSGEFCYCSQDCLTSGVLEMPEAIFEVPDSIDFGDD